MNKYLLLRDNKQSGPYTVLEIIAKGIKPYDLVWLEGKSAAWRYPSEIEELKAYAPAVEEQPFDRFYKKAEQPEQERRSAFEPVIAQETLRKKPDGTARKVYINFPGGQKRVPVYQAPVEKAVELVLQPVQAQPTPAYNSAAPAARSDKGLLYAVIGTCCILLFIISLLFLNYRNQSSSIKQLNQMVQQMQKRQEEQNRAARAALATPVISRQVVNDLPPAAPATEEPLPPATKKEPVATHKIAVELPQPVAPETSNEAVTAVQEKAVAPPPKKVAKEDLYRLVSVTPNKFKTGMLGGISNLQFVLHNNSSHLLQRVAVEIKYLSPEKKIVKTQIVYFENVAPGGEPILDVPKSSRGVHVDYAITEIK